MTKQFLMLVGWLVFATAQSEAGVVNHDATTFIATSVRGQDGVASLYLLSDGSVWRYEIELQLWVREPVLDLAVAPFDVNEIWWWEARQVITQDGRVWLFRQPQAVWEDAGVPPGYTVGAKEESLSSLKRRFSNGGDQ